MSNMNAKLKNAVVEDNQALWSVDAERLILYADIMGFKDRVSTTDHEELKSQLLTFIGDFKRKIDPLLSGDYIRCVQFSDSIIIVANGVDSKMFNIITKAGICLMHIAMRHSFPIKGVMAKGVFTYDEDNDLYFGQPLVDAYALHDELYYYGIVVHHSVEPLIKKYHYLRLPFSKSQIPLKKGKTAHYHLSWHMVKENLSIGSITPLADKWLETIEEHVSGAPRIYVDNTRATFKEDKLIVTKKDAADNGDSPTSAI